VSGDDPGLGDRGLGRVQDGNAADGQRAGAVGVHAVRRSSGVSEDHLDVIDRCAQWVAGDLAPRRGEALIVVIRPPSAWTASTLHDFTL
jgi:hypothetical protein